MIATLTENDRWGNDWMCHTCARVRGGRWREGQTDAPVSDVCGYCGAYRQLSNLYCWSWPDSIVRGAPQ